MERSTTLTLEEKELRELFSKIPLAERSRLSSSFGKKKVIVISGPTAVGKTKHSLALAKALKGEIVSADSMQVYNGMDIGTAKATVEERGDIPHHLIDLIDLSHRFNVMDFYTEAMKAIRSALARNRVPIVVGGTGFYIHALLYGPPLGPPSVPEVRDRLEKEMEERGMEVLFSRLKEADPSYAKTITGADRHKVIRALEIMELTGKKVTDFARGTKGSGEFDFRCWFLYMPKEHLYPQIEMRCDEMIARGLIEEVRRLDKEGLRDNESASSAIGYRQTLTFLDSPGGPTDFETFVASLKRASRRYAKRQVTWFKKEAQFRWLDVHKIPFERSVQAILQDYELGDVFKNF